MSITFSFLYMSSQTAVKEYITREELRIDFAIEGFDITYNYNHVLCQELAELPRHRLQVSCGN